MSTSENLAHFVQELRELGLDGTLYRAGREARIRAGIEALFDRGEPSPEADLGAERLHDDALMGAWAGRFPFAEPSAVVPLVDRIPAPQLAALGERARAATRGKIRCFGRWTGDFGNPIDWHKNPVTGARWDPDCHWSSALDLQPEVGDVKLTWEVGRFPHAYEFARAATFGQGDPTELATALDAQIRSFVSNNPFGRGVHWNSGQEIAFRFMALTFSVSAFARLGHDLGSLPAFVARAAFAAAHHLEQQLDFAQRAIYNNHLLSEAVGLMLASWMLPPSDTTRRWGRVGERVMDEQADRQIYRDGAYIQQSHNYHRVALQDYLWACRLNEAAGRAIPAPWLGAMERSLDFLVAHQNPGDGRLPNYGANDGALPCPLTCCDYADFRPTLQAVSMVTRGERLYEPGPWDEAAAWMVGAAALDAAPIHPRTRRSVAFDDTGFYVLRGRDPSSFGAFRCGTIRDRFSQIDMLHLDVWWRGQNVLVDAGSYLYNGPEIWHRHFLATECHNTVQVDGRDQMLHYRQFKCLYWTHAKRLSFEDREGFAAVAGEHTGYARHPGGCVHRRSVLYVKDDLWIVVDRITGTGEHTLRLHWLGGDFPVDDASAEGRMILRTAEGPFTVQMLDARATPLPATLVRGQESPPRGWSSRYYAEKTPVPSLAAEVRGSMPTTLVSVLAAGTPTVTARDGRWSVETATGTTVFTLDDAHAPRLVTG